jgi:plasmid stability protein
MASITIRNLDQRTKNRLRVRAARNGHSMEEEARRILRTALIEKTAKPGNLYDAIRKRIDPIGGVELELPPRGPMREPPTFE